MLFQNYLIEELVNKFNNLYMNRKKETFVIDENTRSTVKYSTDYYRGVVYADNNYVEFGYFKRSPSNIVIKDSEGLGEYVLGISYKVLSKYYTWSNNQGAYIYNKDIEFSKLTHTLLKGQGEFPYFIPKKYEAIESFNIFQDAQKVLEDVDYPLSKVLNYTIGLEFETSMGYIPQELCFRDGLIPLRDGSISGIEYSTVILEGNKGLNLLKQQCDTLKKYTTFNKECALHIHFGNFPVDEVSIFALYCVWYLVERNLLSYNYVPNYTFKTEKYKHNGKSYCKMMNIYADFEDMYEVMTGDPYMGCLYQPHPSDLEGRAKWNIKSRYYSLNLINMICYNKAKTVEFRFLRPTFNYRKITLWIYILNAVLEYAKVIAKEWSKSHYSCINMTEGMLNYVGKLDTTIQGIIKAVYDEPLVSSLYKETDLLKIATALQTQNGDFYGRDTYLEDEIFT